MGLLAPIDSGFDGKIFALSAAQLFGGGWA
jgi:hypothetical protein